jgi:hypothetical protein
MAVITRNLMQEKIDRYNEMKVTQQFVFYKECKIEFILACQKFVVEEAEAGRKIEVEKINMLFGEKVGKWFNKVISEEEIAEGNYCSSRLLPDYFSIPASNLRESHMKLQKNSRYKAYVVAKAAFKKHRKANLE